MPDCALLRQWSDAAGEAEAAQRPIRCQILGNDIHEGALGLALRDATASGVGRAIRLHAYDVADWVPPVPPTLVVTNPPWGLRLMERGRGDDRWVQGVDSSCCGRMGFRTLMTHGLAWVMVLIILHTFIMHILCTSWAVLVHVTCTRCAMKPCLRVVLLQAMAEWRRTACKQPEKQPGVRLASRACTAA